MSVLDPASKAHAVANTLRQVEQLTAQLREAKTPATVISDPDELGQWINTVEFFESCYPGRFRKALTDLEELAAELLTLAGYPAGMRCTCGYGVSADNTVRVWSARCKVHPKP